MKVVRLRNAGCVSPSRMRRGDSPKRVRRPAGPGEPRASRQFVAMEWLDPSGTLGPHGIDIAGPLTWRPRETMNHPPGDRKGRRLVGTGIFGLDDVLGGGF